MNERDLRDWLDDRAPTAAPDELRARVAAISSAPPIAVPRARRRSLRGRRSWRNGLLLAAAFAASIGGAAFLAGRSGPRPDATVSPPVDNGLIAIAASGVALLDPVTGEGIGGLRTPSETWSATWSRDGRMLAFGSRDGIWTMDIATGAEGLVATVEGCRGRALVGLRAAWSPDGRTIAVTEDSQLLLVDVASGAVVVHLDERGADIRSPTWSPDGATLAFFVDSTLFSVPAAAGPATVVSRSRTRCGCPATSRSPRRHERWPGWHSRSRTDDGQAHRHRRQQRRRHESAGPVRRWLLLLHLRQLGSPGFGWSPDGTQMAFVTQFYHAVRPTVPRLSRQLGWPSVRHRPGRHVRPAPEPSERRPSAVAAPALAGRSRGHALGSAPRAPMNVLAGCRVE